jgi:hypothetical protein
LIHFDRNTCLAGKCSKEIAMRRYTGSKRLRKRNPSSKTIRGATEYSIAPKVLKIFTVASALPDCYK